MNLFCGLAKQEILARDWDIPIHKGLYYIPIMLAQDAKLMQRLAAKRPKDAGPWTVELEPTADVARALGERKRAGQVLVAFGAEHGAEGLERKRAMLESKNVDLVVFNDVGRSDIGFDTVENEVVLITREGERTVPKAPKSAIAAAILDEVEGLLA